jgi:hypothetical protein
MNNLIQIYTDISNEKYLKEKIKHEELFVLCRENVEDDKETICAKGKLYKVIGILNNCWIVEGKNHLININKEDYDFIPLVKGGGDNGN